MKNEEEKNIENQDLRDATPSTILGYDDTVTIGATTICIDPNDVTATITLDSGVKLFARKFSYHERENCNYPNGNPLCCNRPSQGDYFGFTLIFGNYGNQCYDNTTTNPTLPTLTDMLNLSAIRNSNLTIVDLCIPDCYRLIRGTGDVINPCDSDPKKRNNVFVGGTDYTLTLQKCPKSNGECNEKEWISNFDIPCHYVCSISILCKVDPTTPCIPPCDCSECSRA